MPFTNPFYYILCLVFSPVWWFGDPGGFTDVIFGWIGIAMIWFAVAGFGPKVIKFFEDSEKEARYNKHKEREERKERIKRKSKQKIEESQAGPRMTGTAFFIDQKGHLITNFHVIDGCGNNLKAMCDNEEIKCRVIAIDKSLDLALLKVNFKSESYVQIDDKILSKMQPIIAAGYPALHLSDDLKLTSGIISSLKGFNNNSALIQIDAALNSGNSGGPIIDKEDGKLAAVAVARMEGSHYQSINYGIKSSRVKEFIESNKIKLPKKKIRTKKIKRKEIADNLENTTVLVFH